jgi:hypothetical protein
LTILSFSFSANTLARGDKLAQYGIITIRRPLCPDGC